MLLGGRLDRIPMFLLGLTVYNFVLHHLGKCPEDLIDRFPALGTALHISEIMMVGHFLSFFSTDFPGLVQVHLIAYNHDLGLFFDCFREVLDPVPCMIYEVLTE